MTTARVNRYSLILIAVVAGAVAFGVYGFLKFGILRLRVALAEEQTRMFQECRERGLASTTAKGAVDFVDAALTYYPSGTKQRTGSHLDLMVERSRRLAMEDILDHLRTLTGTNYGAEPQAWIKALRSPEEASTNSRR